jgi:hypothetical protein
MKKEKTDYDLIKGRCKMLSEKMEWRTDFENIPKGYFIASYCGKSHLAYKLSKRSKKCNLHSSRDSWWYYGFDFKDIDGWMPMPEGMKK